ncbi:MAG: GtrA family protein [Ignavibacteria bacterium]|jgi:dolichol-phosphate mannosyltransferase
MINRVLNFAAPYKKYFGKFALVGSLGMLVNQGVLTLLTLVYNVNLEIAGIVSIEFSILSNFFLNNSWTWKEKRENSFLIRFLRYHLVTFVSGAANYAVLLLFTYFGLHHLISNLIGIGCGVVINFFMNHYWTFRE